MKTHRVLPLFACALLLGCGANPDEAKEVAQAFWEASKTGDTELAMSYVSNTSSARINQSEDDDPVGDIILGDAEVDGDEATVPTTLTNVGDETPMDVSFQTTLIREDGEWKVDLDRTMGNMMGSMLGASVGAMAQAMGEAMGSAMQGMAEGMQEGFEALNDSLKAGSSK
jgi:hypothetical protein